MRLLADTRRETAMQTSGSIQMTYVSFAENLLAPAAGPPDGLVAWTGEPPTRRYGVYRNNVGHSLTMAIESRFPVSRRIVGDAFFTALAQAYVRVEPPRSPLLMTYGDGLADFVRTFPPAASVPYLADVLVLESARGHAYHAADAVPLDVAVLAAVAPDDLAGLRFIPHPSLQLLSSAYPVHTIWTMNGEGREPGPVADWIPESVAICRPQMVVETHRLSAGMATFLATLSEGGTLGAAAQAAHVADTEFDLPEAFRLMIAGGFFAGLA